MFTSDDQVVDGVTYRIVLKSTEYEDLILTINAKTYGLLLETWRLMESRQGRRISFPTFMVEISRGYLAHGDAAGRGDR